MPIIKGHQLQHTLFTIRAYAERVPHRKTFKTLVVKVENTSDEFISNAKHFAKKKEYFKLATAMACAGGGPKIAESHRQRNKMLAEERLHSVIDKDTEFLELSNLAGLGMDYGNVPRAGIITGISIGIIFSAIVLEVHSAPSN